MCFWSENHWKLGHIILKEGVHPDPEKVSAMIHWKLPKNLRGFLGLTGYYKRFTRGYAQIAAPMTDLLKKDNFHWSEEATISFEALKISMNAASVLIFPDFDKQCKVEIDACNSRVEAVLIQEKHLISFYSCKISGRIAATSVYIKEIYAIIQVVGK